MLTLVPLSPKAPLTLAGENWGAQPWGAGRVLKGPAGVWDKGGGSGLSLPGGRQWQQREIQHVSSQPQPPSLQELFCKGLGEMTEIS